MRKTYIDRGKAAALVCLLCCGLWGCGLAFCGFSGKSGELAFDCGENAEPTDMECGRASDGHGAEASDMSDGMASDGDGGAKTETPDGAETAPGGVSEGSPAAPEGNAEETAPAASDGRVNINTAGMEELMTLKGVGESRARAIIEYREQNGPFETEEEIMQISGIKEGVFSNIKDQIAVR
ncbi:MAG: helix-hairpin-helix domain-containing protein [Eubacteriales bacterium]|nr:helix-hairpin-helix domain-containing protein [Eubacteriales bacterium]